MNPRVRAGRDPRDCVRSRLVSGTSVVLAAAWLLSAASCASSYTAGVSGGGFGLAATTPAKTTATPGPIVYVVRHAEAAEDGSRDPELSRAGVARAGALRAALAGAGIGSIYATPYRRTQMTGEPLARELGIDVTTYDPGDAAALVRKILETSPGGNVLVVGHSNTVPQIVEALGGPRVPDLAHAEHDPIFVVRKSAKGTTVAVLRYGAACDSTAAD
jgi:phosphohistidine phosphatase SixA